MAKDIVFKKEEKRKGFWKRLISSIITIPESIEEFGNGISRLGIKGIEDQHNNDQSLKP